MALYGKHAPDDEDYMSPQERAEIEKMFKPAGRQRFASEKEQQNYLRLVSDLEHPPFAFGLTKGQAALIALVAVLVGFAVGRWWGRTRRPTQPTKRTPDLVGLDVFVNSHRR